MSERIVIKVPKRYSLTSLPKTLSVSTIASWLVYGLNSPPPTENICRSAALRRILLQKYGSHEPICQRAISVVANNKTSKLTLKGNPDYIDRLNIPTIIELRLYSKKSEKSRENTIEVAKVKLQLYMNMLNIPKGEITLFGIEEKDPSKVPVIKIEYYDKVFSPNTKQFRKLIIAALRIRQQKQRRDKIVSNIQKTITL